MGTNNFSVNLSLKTKDVLELREIILNFLKAKVEDKVVSLYRKENNGDRYGLVIGEEIKPEDPTPEKLDELLEIVKDVPPIPEGEKDRVLIIITFPI